MQPIRRLAAVATLLAAQGFAVSVAAAQNVVDPKFGDQNAANGLSEGNPVIPGLFADPAIAKFGDTFYLYTTTDGFGWQTGRWVTWTSNDLVHWSFKGESFPEITGQSNWAPGKPIFQYLDGFVPSTVDDPLVRRKPVSGCKYFLPFTLGGNTGHIAVADNPRGPWRFAFDRDRPLYDSIDSELFVDDDGTPWTIWGGTHIYLSKLTPNLAALDGPKQELKYDKGYVEGPFLFKRNGVYYACAANLGYAEYRMIYARAEHLAGPWTYPKDNIVLEPDPANHLWGVGHGNVFNVGDDYYVVYLRSRSGEVGVDPFQSAGNVYRQICIDRLQFNPDGSIVRLKPTRAGVKPVGTPEDRGTNVALGKAATASSSLDGYGPEKATDGGFGTRWVVGHGDAIAMTAEHAKVRWRYTTDQPPDNWNRPTFDASSWSEGFGGFGTQGTPNAIIGTDWHGPDIWLRRDVELTDEQLQQTLALRVNHDDAAEIYVNGQLAARLNGFDNRYASVPIRPEALASLRAGHNTLAVHCAQERGGQYIDVGLTAAANEPWWQTDLGAPTKIERTELSFNYPTELTPYVIEYSTDGKAWTTYGDHLRDTVRESPKVDVGSVTARYFRLRFAAPTVDQIPAGIWEFKAFDKP